MGNSKKVLLIGWDAADWKVIHKLMDEGKMPTVQNLVENGTMGNMATLFPALSPMLWTSIATGKRPYKHGIYGFTEPTPGGLGVQPMTNMSRRSKAIWNILNQQGMKSLVVGWWPSHPAEPINGAMVSDFYHKAPRKPTDRWPMMKNCVHPDTLQDAMNQMRLHPSKLEGKHVLPFVPKAAEIDQDRDSRLSGLMRTLSECVTLHRAGETLLRTQEWDFAAIYYDAIDHFCHGYMKFHPPKQDHIRQDDYEMFKDVVNQSYVYHDQMLAKLIDAAGEETTIILMSDHGFHPDHLRPKAIPTEPAGPAVEHRNLGIFVVSGPGIRKDHVVYGANLLDVAPTILSLYDLPYGEDMDGKPLLEIYQDKPDVKLIPSWEDVDGDDGQHAPGSVMDAVESKETMEQLVALGYIERPDADNTVAVKNCQRELDYNLARAYMDGNQHGDAIPLLTNLYNENPIEFRFGLQLANCLQAMNRPKDLEILVKDLNERWRVARGEARKKIREIAKVSKERRLKFRELKKIDTENEEAGKDVPKLAHYDFRGKPVLFSPAESNAIRKIRTVARGNPQILDFLSATIAASNNDFEEAIDYMAKAETSKSNNPMYHVQLGNFYLALKRADDAERSFSRALEIDSLNANALLGMCRCNTLDGRPRKAVDFGKQAVGLRYQFPIGHFYLGEAQMMSKDMDGAIKSFNTALGQNPNFVEAHRNLAEIYTTVKTEQDLALEHTAAADELVQELGGYRDNTDPIKLDPVGQEEFADLLPKIETEDTKDFVKCISQPKPTMQHLESVDKYKPNEEDIIIVTGLPRSGTSMMMQMLSAGGVEPYTDETRKPDESNPRGYFESEKVKKLAFKNRWIEECAGKVLKVVAPLISYLPQHLKYKIVLMNRDMDEIVRSQTAMLDSLSRTGGDLTDEKFKEIFTAQLQGFYYLMKANEISYCEINHRDTIGSPESVATKVREFLGLDLDLEKMVSAVDPSLYRQKSTESE